MNETGDATSALITAAWALCYSKLVVLGAVLALSPFNFMVILRTSVVHPHLRFVLIVQSAATVLAAIAVSVIVINEFLVGDPLARLSPQFYAVYTFLYSFTAMLGHVLLLERVLATVMAHRYEQWRSPWFSAGWCILLTGFSLSCSISYYQMNAVPEHQTFNISIFMVVTNYCTLAFSFIEIIVMAKLGLYNASVYAQSQFYTSKKRTLSERYQLSENVRTIRQLGPILAAHFLQLLPANLAFNVPYFKLLDPGALAMQLLYSINNFIFALTILIIAVAMNAFHPVLRERALRLRKNVLTTVGRLRRLRNRVSASSTDENSRQHEGQGSQHQRQGPRPIAIELTSYFERNFSSDDHHHYGGGEGHGEDGGGGRGGGGGQLDADGEAHFRAIEQCWERAATAAAASHQKKK